MKLFQKENPILYWRILTLCLLCISYSSVVLCRNAFFLLLPRMKEEGINSEKAGAILSFGTFLYLTGKLINGTWVDYLGGRAGLIIAILFTCISTLGLSYASQYHMIILFWGLCRYFQSGAWPSLSKIVYSWFDDSQYATVWGFLSASSRSGAIITSAIMALLSIFTDSWRSILRVFAFIAASIWVVLLFCLRDQPSGSKKEVMEEPEITISTPYQSPLHRLLYFLRSRMFWSLMGSYMPLILVYELESYLPLFQTEAFRFGEKDASTGASLFAFGGTISVLFSGYFLDRLSRKQMAMTMLSFVFGIIASLVVIRNLTLKSSDVSHLKVFSSLFVLGLCLAPPCYIPPNLFALRFGGKDKAATLTGLIDAMAYPVAMVFDFIAGSLASSIGWTTVIEVCIVSSFLALFFTGWYFYLELQQLPNNTLLPTITDHQNKQT